jgi:hypothetical protein
MLSQPSNPAASRNHSARTLALIVIFIFALSGCKTAQPADDASLLTAVQIRISSDSALAREPIETSIKMESLP